MFVPLAPSQRRAPCRPRARPGPRPRKGTQGRALGDTGAADRRSAARDRHARAGRHPPRHPPRDQHSAPGRPDRPAHARGAHRARRRVPGAGHRRHRRAGRAVLARLGGDPRRPEQHLRALAAPARAGHRRHRQHGAAAGRGRGRQDAVRQLRGGRPVLGRPRPAVFRHDVADRQQRGRDRLRRGEIHRPGDDHRLPVRRGQQHLDLAAGRREQADHARWATRSTSPTWRRSSSSARSGWPGRA